MRKFKFTHQRDSLDCASACLKMVCDYYLDKSIPLSYIRNLSCNNKLGTSISELEKAASELGLSAQTYKVKFRDISLVNFPCILLEDQMHYIVLIGFDKKDHLKIADPASGIYCLSNLEADKRFAQNGNQIVIVTEVLPENINNHLDIDKTLSSSNFSNFKFLIAQFLKYKKEFSQICIGILFGCLLQLIAPILTQSIVDIGIANSDVNFIWMILIGMLVVVLGRTFSDFVRGWLLLHMSMKINVELLSKYIKKLLRLPLSFFDSKYFGDLLQRMSDHNRVQTFLTSDLLGCIFSVSNLLMFGFVLIFYKLEIFAVFIISSFIYVIWIVRFVKLRKIIDYELFEIRAHNQNITYQLISNIAEIKIQGCAAKRCMEWEDNQVKMYRVQRKALKLQQQQEVGRVLINEIEDIIITFIAAYAVIKGEMTLGGLVAISFIVGQLKGPVEQLMKNIYTLQDINISLDRIHEVTSLKSENCDTSVNACVPYGDIEFRHVTFRYPGANHDAVRNLSFKIPKGRMIAIVGASGQGKTTLLKLLLGYYPICDGNITIDGTSLNMVDISKWREKCGVVLQDGVIFYDSVAGNIAVKDTEFDMKRIRYVARIACIDEEIMRLPMQYSTKIGADGLGISEGQKQRILIARALYKDPELLILDEATNSLDTENERNIVNNLRTITCDKTVLVIAHRLSTIRMADKIVVLDKGQISEVGTHAELMQNKSKYFSLISNQLEFV